MHNDNDEETYRLTEADRTSETRFGPRPVPEGHKVGNEYPYRARVSSKIPPSGRVSPDGIRAWPEPSLTSKVVVWGGVLLGVAGVTAGAVMAGRKLAGTDSDEPAQPQRRVLHSNRRNVAPRFADLDEDERDDMRSRVRAQSRRDDRDAARLRAEASRMRQKPRGNFARELTETANGLSNSLTGVAGALSSAFQGFRGVATQATGIVAEFALAADQLRAVLNPDHTPRQTQTETPRPDPAHQEAQRDYDEIQREEERSKQD